MAKFKKNPVSGWGSEPPKILMNRYDYLKQIMVKLEKANQVRESESYPCLVSESTDKREG